MEQIVTALMVAVVGFTACSEFGSYAFVHPVIRRLPTEHHIAVEKGLVRTFGRFMPVAMPASIALIVAWSTLSAAPAPLEIAPLVLWGIGLVTTIIVNVGINTRTAQWASTSGDAAAWQAMRRHWETFQAIRSWAFLAAFALICVAVTGTG